MITIKGVTVTEQNETLDYHERLKALDSEAPIPDCNRCNRMTEYILADPQAMPFLIVSRYQLDGYVLVAVKTCWRCGAAEDGYAAGKHHPHKQAELYAKIPNMALKPLEIPEYQKIWSMGFQKARKIFDEKAVTASKDRYRMKE